MKNQLGVAIHTENHQHTFTAILPNLTVHLTSTALILNAKEGIAGYQVTSTIAKEHLQTAEKDTFAAIMKVMAINLQEVRLHRHTNLTTMKTGFTTNEIETHSIMT